MSADVLDRQVRLRAFDFLSEQTALHGEVLQWSILSSGFVFDGKRVPLIGPQGIFKPAILPDMPISIATAPAREGEPRPYDDGLDEQGLLSYRYRGTDPRHRDNVGLRLAMQRRVPLIYLFGVVKGEYMPVWPVFIVGDDPSALTFEVAFDDRQLCLLNSVAPTDQIAEARRSYVTALTVRRLHQTTFRMRVLNAYRETCAICRLRHRELLEAAHILPDGHPRGEPIVPNGLALCKLHHAAFDAYILGVRPDYVIEVRRDILEEIDGPMLRHGLQEIAGQLIQLPRDQRLRPGRICWGSGTRCSARRGDGFDGVTFVEGAKFYIRRRPRSSYTMSLVLVQGSRGSLASLAGRSSDRSSTLAACRKACSPDPELTSVMASEYVGRARGSLPT